MFHKYTLPTYGHCLQDMQCVENCDDQDPRKHQLFEEPVIDDRFKFSLPATVSSVVDRVCSKSYIAVLPEGERNKVCERVRELVQRSQDKVWIDENNGIFEYPYTTTVVLSKLKRHV